MEEPNMKNTLTFAVLGHPNEGKSSVVSTLTENARVRISDTPGETLRCLAFVVSVEGETALTIIDTPGFQNPAATLAWFEQWQGAESEMVDAFIRTHADDPDFHHDLELMIPLRDRAAVLYVADASRPLREADRQEMELLRLIGLPRMALLNCKRDDRSFISEWEEALKRRFNLIREFNAHHATFAERLMLYDAMAHLIPDQAATLQALREKLIAEWQNRIEDAVLEIEALLIKCQRHQLKIRCKPENPLPTQQQKASEKYQEDLKKFEAHSRREWRRLYHHDQLPGVDDGADLISEELFAEKVWKLLGLSRRQLLLTGAAAGGAAGVGADLATGGISFGIFTAGGAILGGLGAWMGAPGLGAKKLPLPGGRHLAREDLVVGPHTDPQLLFVLLDRSLLYLTRLMNWAHARQDHTAFLAGLTRDAGLVRSWSDQERKLFQKWIKVHRRPGHPDAPRYSGEFRRLLVQKLQSSATDSA